MANPVDIVPSLGHSALTTQVSSPAGGYDAIDDRRYWTGYERGEGVATYESFRVRQRGAGANMTVDVGMDEPAYVRGDSVSLQGLYQAAPSSATLNVDVAASDPTNPRIDLVILEVKDDLHDTGGLNKARIRVVTGTPTGGATLDNRSGVAATPPTSILLADVLVPALATTVVDANIRDRRPFVSGVPPVLTRVDMVSFKAPGFYMNDNMTDVAIAHAVHDLHQAAALMYLPRRIVNATRIRWKYAQQAAAAITGNYVLGIYDASGRKIVDTGTVAWTGATNSFQVRSETITATTFEAGWYYVMIGNDSGAGGVQINGISFRVVAGLSEMAAHAPNVGLRSTTGGVTAPSTLLAFTDVNSLVAAAEVPAVPFVALSVG